MDKKIDYDLDTICDSVIFGKPLTEAEEKKDDENDNPFAPPSDSGSDDSGDKGDDSTADDKPSDDASDSTDDAGKEDDSTDDSSDSNEGGDSPFGGTDEGGDTDDAGDTTDDDTAPGEISTEQYSDVADFGIELLVLSMQAHFWHINARKNGDHNILDSLYHGLGYQADRLLETVISHTKMSIQAGSELSFDFGDLEFNKEESIGILEDVRAEANELVSRYQDEQDIVDGITQAANVLSEAIYKLSRFDSNEAV